MSELLSWLNEFGRSLHAGAHQGAGLPVAHEDVEGQAAAAASAAKGGAVMVECAPGAEYTAAPAPSIRRRSCLLEST